MKKVIIIPMVLFVLSCSNLMRDNTNIGESIIVVSIIDESSDAEIYHLYFENINEKSASRGYNYKNNNCSVNIFPGEYNIYCYGLDRKDSVKFMPVSGGMITKKIRFNSEDVVEISMIEIIPEYELVYSLEKEKFEINIDFKKYDVLFSISSISIKQGDQRVRGLEYRYINEDQKYLSETAIECYGDWFFNLSYSVNNKIDKKVLSSDGISITTNSFSNLFLALVD